MIDSMMRENRYLRPSDHPQMSVRAKLSRRHSESLAKLLAEVVLRIEPAAPGDLRHAQGAVLQKARGFLQSFFLEKVAQKTSGHSMKPAGDVLSRVPELFCHCLDGDLLVIANTSADTLDQ